MEEVIPQLPNEQVYMPQCSNEVLQNLGLIPGETAFAIAKIGKGNKFEKF